MSKKPKQVNEDVIRYELVVNIKVDGTTTMVEVISITGDVVKSTSKILSPALAKGDMIRERMYMIRQVVGEAYTELANK